MFCRNAFALCTLVLLGLVLTASAKPQDLDIRDVEIETFSLLEDLIEYMKDNLKIAKECIEDALTHCKEQYPGKFYKLPKCVLEYVLQKKGLCNITNHL